MKEIKQNTQIKNLLEINVSASEKRLAKMKTENKFYEDLNKKLFSDFKRNQTNSKVIN